MRLAEAAGLGKEDFMCADDGSLSVRVRRHPWRRLKTQDSERDVPLEGNARWAAQRTLKEAGSSQFAFPRYNRSDTTNANAASAALNKWMKELVPAGYTMHGFRHSMRDRLRAVECPADVDDQIGGWRTDGVGHSYGTGYPLEVLRKCL
ncbi:tyrosine-type recombinase/integrase [Ruegeria sp.]|uniref:tyrosine-type recombinase/integrase n=1 Tax=Ruegeria sp. TaxID=1879320 RepID=UPI003AFF6172